MAKKGIIVTLNEAFAADYSARSIMPNKSQISASPPRNTHAACRPDRLGRRMGIAWWRCAFVGCAIVRVEYVWHDRSVARIGAHGAPYGGMYAMFAVK